MSSPLAQDVLQYGVSYASGSVACPPALPQQRIAKRYGSSIANVARGQGRHVAPHDVSSHDDRPVAPGELQLDLTSGQKARCAFDQRAGTGHVDQCNVVARTHSGRRERNASATQAMSDASVRRVYRSTHVLF